MSNGDDDVDLSDVNDDAVYDDIDGDGDDGDDGDDGIDADEIGTQVSAQTFVGVVFLHPKLLVKWCFQHPKMIFVSGTT